MTFDKCGYCQVPRGAYHKPICVVYRMGGNKYTGAIKYDPDMSLAGMPSIPPSPIKPDRPAPPKLPRSPMFMWSMDGQTWAADIARWSEEMNAWTKEMDAWLAEHS